MHPAENYSAVETYNHLLLNEMGKKEYKTEGDIKKAEEMRDFLMINFGTDKVQNVDIADLKSKLEGPSLLSRIAYR
jgi:3'-phosphoadenosine 5'-phosphosulfate sulfotransferase